MYAIIRRYRTTSVKRVVRKIEQEFLPVISGAPGFVAYYVVDEGQGLQSSFSIFKDQASAEYSNRLAAAFVREHPTALPEPPDISAGEVLLYKSEDGEEYRPTAAAI